MNHDNMEHERKPNSPIYQKPKKIKLPKVDSNQVVLIFQYLHQDVIVEILTWLPVKSLLKFRCVSKSWRSFISSPYFIKAHLQKSSKNHVEVLLTRFIKPFDLEICSLNSLLCNPVVDTTVLWQKQFFEVVDSCNGLVCIICRLNGDMFLWNPTTRKYRKLPDSEPIFRFQHCGFGFDESTNDYKIVKYMRRRWKTGVEVYSLETDSWKRIEAFPGTPLDKYAKFVNGKFHWRARQSYGREKYIVSLDIHTKTYGKVEMPLSINSGRVRLGVLGGCLSMLISYSSEPARGDLWILKEYGMKQSWTKVVHIPYGYPNDCMGSLPLYNGQILLSCGSKFALYNPKDQSLMNPIVNKISRCSAANIYVESLVSPSPNDGPGGECQ